MSSLSDRYSNLTMEEVEKYLAGIFYDKANFKGATIIGETETHYEIRGGGVYGLFPKKEFDEALKKATNGNL